MGEMDVNLPAFAETSGRDFLRAVREAGTSSYGVPGTGPTGVRSRSRESQSEVTEVLGLGHRDSLEPPVAALL